MQLKQQLTAKGTKVVKQEPAREPGSDSAWEIRELEMKIGELHLQVDGERKRNENLQRKVEELTTAIGKERKKCKKIIETLANEVERLTNLVKAQGRNGYHLNGHKINHERQDTIKMGTNKHHIDTFPLSKENEIKQFYIL